MRRSSRIAQKKRGRKEEEKTEPLKKETKKKKEPEKDLNARFLKEAKKGNTEAVAELLQDPRVDVTHEDDDKFNALDLACREGHAGVVEVLLKDGRIDPSARNNLAVYVAAWKGRLEVLKLLLK